MLNTRFSVFQAYVTGLKVLLEYISFYLTWYAITLCAGFVAFVSVAVYVDAVSLSALTQDYSWIWSFISRWFISDIKVDTHLIPTDFSPYGFFELLLPKEILNHTLDIMSWTEYLHIVLMPKAWVLFFALSAIAMMIMTVSIGFIKTALSVQSDGYVCFHDMYQFFYIVPSYAAGKILVLAGCLLPLLITGLVVKAIPSLFIIELVVGVAVAIFVYQRLRFTKYFIIDQEMSPVQACIASWHMTYKSVFHLMIISILAVMLITTFSGLLLSILVMLDKQAEVSIYRQLLASK